MPTENAKADTPTTAEKKAAAAEPKTVTVVQYVGNQTWREITNDDWTRLEIPTQDTLRWDPENKHSVPKSEVRAKALAFLLENEGDDFLVTEQVIAEEETPAGL